MKRRMVTSIACVVAFAAVLPLTSTRAGAARVRSDVPASVGRQVARMMGEKNGRSATQHKMASGLAAAVDRAAASTPLDPVAAAAVASGRITVDVTATIDEPLLDRVVALGGRVVGSYPAFDSVRADLPLPAVDELAAQAQVRSVRPAEEPVVNTASPSDSAITSSVGAASSEGDKTHLAEQARTTFNVNGTGVKVGVLSDGVDNLATSVTSGDLSAVTVIPGQAGAGSEGRAMLEIVHDLAPGAQLYFATAQGGQAAMAQNILSLQAAGCTVIVDDVSYATDPPFQDGILSRAVNTVTAAGVTYLSSAGNWGRSSAGNSGVWEGDFVPGTVVSGGTFHDFDPGPALREANHLAGTTNDSLVLTWADPLGAAADDYDLYVVDANGTLLASSTTDQLGASDPVEFVALPPGAAAAFVVLAAGSPRYLRLHLLRRGGLVDFSTAGAAYGHNAAANTISVAATPAAVANGSGPMGPYPGPFTAANTPELFSADGPRRVFFSPSGAPYTSGNSSATGGKVLSKPDVAAADGVATSVVPTFAPFFGTSAAAPHAAAIVALMRSLRPAASVAQIAASLRLGVVDVAPAGFDRDNGHGILMAPLALQAIADAAPVPLTDFVPIVPERVLETRAAAGQRGYTGPRPAAGQTLELVVTGVGANPVPADAVAVALNVTATGATAAGFVTVWPCGAPRPLASNLNLTANDTRANLVITKIGTFGKVCLFTQSPTDLIADVGGYMPDGSAYVAVVPERLLETRPGAPIGYVGAKPVAGQTIELQVTGAGVTKVPADAAAVVLNVTATEATVAGYVTVWPCGAPRPTASNLNLTPGVTAPNLVVSKIGAGGKVCLFAQNGGHLLADVAGYDPAVSAFSALVPQRILDSRIGLGTPVGPPSAGRIVQLQVGGVAGVPANATTAVLNVTGTNVTVAGFVTVWPCGAPKPTASNLNLAVGDTRPNLVLAKVGAGGAVCLFTLQPADLVADLVGFYVPGT